MNDISDVLFAPIEAVLAPPALLLALSRFLVFASLFFFLLFLRFTDAGAKVSGAKSPYAKIVSYANDFIFADFLPACQKCSIVPIAKTNCHLCKTSKAEFDLFSVRLSIILSVK
jgi:hypothetical protein